MEAPGTKQRVSVSLQWVERMHKQFIQTISHLEMSSDIQVMNELGKLKAMKCGLECILKNPDLYKHSNN